MAKPVPIPWPLTSAPGQHPAESEGRLINAYVAPLGDKRVARRRVPGLELFATSTADEFRGGLALSTSTLLAAWGETLFAVHPSGAIGLVDHLPGNSRVRMARNNKAGTPDIVAVNDAGAFTVTMPSTVTSFADVDLPSSVDVCFLHGYFFFFGSDGRCFATAINDVTVNALTFATAEFKSDAGLRCIPWNDQLLLWGTESIEFWSDTANDPPGFPFSKSTAIPRGLAGSNAIAGYEDGFGHALIFVGNDNAVYQLTGYQPQKISPPDLDRLIAAVDDPETIEASVYVFDGRPMWCLSAPDWTWEFDLLTQKWHERRSYLSDRWQITGTIYAFGKWLAGGMDRKLGVIRPDVRTEYGEPLILRVDSGLVQAFPSRIAVGRADFDLVTGVGIATAGNINGTDPVCRISWSDDGGTRWSIPRERPLGAQGRPQTRVSVFGTGLSGPMGRRWRFEVSDPVDVGLVGGTQSADARAN